MSVVISRASLSSSHQSDRFFAFSERFSWPNLADDDLDRAARNVAGLVGTLRVLREQKIERSLLGRYIFCRQDGRKYGRGLDLAMVRAFKKAGLGAGGLHSLRHSFATPLSGEM